MKCLTQGSRKPDAVSLGSESCPGKQDTPDTHPHSTEQAQPQAVTVNTEAEKGLGTKGVHILCH